MHWHRNSTHRNLTSEKIIISCVNILKVGCLSKVIYYYKWLKNQITWSKTFISIIL